LGRTAEADYEAQMATMTAEEQQIMVRKMIQVLGQAMQNTLYGCYEGGRYPCATRTRRRAYDCRLRFYG